ncbi:MAG: lipase/acyltransferase domain-containing protein [Pseudonocardiaceae bacterium]
MAKVAIPDVVVLLPGITGSVLSKDGTDIWAPTPGAALRGLLSFGRSISNLEVRDDDWRAADLGDGVTATRLVDAAHIIPGLWKIDLYSDIERFLLATFDLTPGVNYFPFPYDWRRDNRASAARLQEKSRAWLAAWRATSGNPHAQLVLIGHSMGGLVARYFVEALGGWRDTTAVVTFGTPFYGSLNAVDYLLNGFRKDLGPFSADLSPLLRSMTSVHQLVPSYRCVYGPDGTATTPAEARLEQWKPAWNHALLTFQREMDDAARANRADPEFSAHPVVYQPITGRDQPTRQSAAVVDGKVELRFDREGSDESGDGTVPLLAAALAGTQQMRTFAPERHARLQTSTPLLNHLSGVIQALHATRVEDLRRKVTSWFALDVDDVYLPGEPVSVHVQALSDLDLGTLQEVETTVAVQDKATGRPVAHRDVVVPRDRTEVVLGELTPGTYLLTVSGPAGTAEVSDVFAVASPEEVEG